MRAVHHAATRLIVDFVSGRIRYPDCVSPAVQHRAWLDALGGASSNTVAGQGAADSRMAFVLERQAFSFPIHRTPQGDDSSRIQQSAMPPCAPGCVDAASRNWQLSNLVFGNWVCGCDTPVNNRSQITNYHSSISDRLRTSSDQTHQVQARAEQTAGDVLLVKLIRAFDERSASSSSKQGPERVYTGIGRKRLSSAPASRSARKILSARCTAISARC